MTIERRTDQMGVDVHFDPHECELFIRLALDAEKVGEADDWAVGHSGTGQTYFSIAVVLGKKMRLGAAGVNFGGSEPTVPIVKAE